MGLDMYLTAKRFLWTEERKNIKITGIKIPEGSTIKEIKIELGYWRKANHIHKWFVDNVQAGNDDCGTYDVSKGQLRTLLEKCRKIIVESKLVNGKVCVGMKFGKNGQERILKDGKIIENDTIAKHTLPTTSGFFFGNTDYNEEYYQDILATIKIIEKANKLPKGWDIFYFSSW